MDQVFLRRAGARINAHVSLVSSENELRSERVFPPTSDPVAAVRFAGRQVAGLGNVSRADGVRVRWARDESLVQDLELEAAFRDAFEEELERLYDQFR